MLSRSSQSRQSRHQLSRLLRGFFSRRQSTDNEPRRGRLLLETLEKRQLLAGDIELLFTDGADNSSSANQAAQTGGLEVQGQAEGEAAPDLVAFARELGNLGVEFYGGEWCPACTQQKELFEDGKNDLPFTEVTNPDRTFNTAITGPLQITSIPTWDFPNGQRLVGVQSLQTLADTAGITIPTSDRPTFEPVGDLTVGIGSPLHVPIDAYDPGNGPLTTTVSVGDPSLLEATVLSGNRSIRIDMTGYGDMVFELFEQRAPRASGRVADLADEGFYDGIIFHRVVDNFVLQAGDPTGTGTSGSNKGTFDDEFHPDLQHNREGILSFAKSTDDTNNSQFFITEVPTRSLDYNHSIFGQMVEGFDVREAISETEVDRDDRPTTNVTIESVNVFEDNENSVVMLKPVGNQTGTTTVTFTVTDPDGNSFSETITVTVGNDTANGQPYLNDITDPAPTPRNTDAQLQLSSVDVEGDSVNYIAESVSTQALGEVSIVPITQLERQSINGSLQTVDNRGRSRVRFDPPSGFSGSIQIQLQALGNLSSFSAQVESSTSSAGTASVNSNTGLLTITPTAGSSLPIDVLITAVSTSNTLLPVYAESFTSDVFGTASVNPTTGLATVDPATDFLGTVDVQLGVTAAAGVVGNALGDRDLQVVPFEFESEGVVTPTAVDLQAGSDSGDSSTDNITNEGTLTFQVTGVIDGQTIELVNTDTGVVVGTGVASGSTIAIATNNFPGLGDGTYPIAARSRVGNDVSQLSPSIAITYDSTQPSSVVSSAVTTANVDRPYVTDLISDEEGSGLVYELVSAPTGATIQSNTGVVNWTPTSGQLGNNTFTLRLTDLAGNTRNESFDVVVAGEPLAEVRLEATDLQGNVVNTLSAGDEFFLNFYGVDARFLTKPGVFAAYADILFDSTLVQPVAGTPIDYSDDFTVVPKGSFATGLIDELGAVSNSVAATEEPESLVATIRMEALGSGTVTILSEPADESNSEFLLFGNDNSIPAGSVAYGSVTLAIGQSFTANDDTITVAEDSGSTAVNVLGNDTVNSGGGNLSVVSVTQPSSGGTVALNGGSVSFTPSANFFGSTEFTYRVSGNGGIQDDATVTVTVSAVNDPPTGIDDTLTVNQNSANNTLEVLANDSIDPDTGETLTITSVSETSGGGTVAISAGNDSLVYSPAADFVGNDTFTYTVSDGSLTTTVDVTVTVVTADDPPTAVDDDFNVTEDDAQDSFDVLTNDTRDADNQSFVIDNVGEPTEGGTARSSSDGSQLLYTPAADFNGTEEVTYTIRDTGGGIAVATATFTVAAVNDPPPLATTTVRTNRGDGEITAFELASLTNPDAGETLTISAFDSASAQGGSIREDTASGTLFYSPPSDSFSGTDTFSVTLDDSNGLTTTGTITVEVSDFTTRSIMYEVPENVLESFGPGAVTLKGVDANGTTVELQPTVSGGTAEFPNLLPGDYTIEVAAIPFFENAETPQSIPVTSEPAEGDEVVQGNIGPLLARYVSIRDFLRTTPRKSLLIAVAPDQSSLMTQASSQTDTIAEPEVTLDASGENLTITGVRDSGGTAEPVSVTLPTQQDSRVELRGQSGDLRLFRVSVEESEVAFTPVTQQVSATTQNAAPATAAAVSTLSLGDTQPEGESVAGQAASGADLFVPTNGQGVSNALVMNTEEGDYWVEPDTGLSAVPTKVVDTTQVDDAMVDVAPALTLETPSSDSLAAPKSLEETEIDAAFSEF